MTKDKCLKIAMRQSALELGCRAEDFVCGENIALPAAPANPAARRYLSLPQDCALVSYGTNVVAAASDRLLPDVREYISRYAAAHCFETPNLLVLEDALRAHGFRVCFMAEYFLPDPARLDAGACGFSIREMHPLDFAPLYLPEWSNALCSDRRDLDVLGMGAYDGDCLVGLAACSADCADMWQIGVDVLPAYRLRGIASTLTARLALAVLARGKGSLLLRRLVESALGAQCAAQRFFPRLGGACRKTCGVCGTDESGECPPRSVAARMRFKIAFELRRRGRPPVRDGL